MNIIVISKEPILERVPNLKSFILYASKKNINIVILTTNNPTFPEPVFKNSNIRIISIKERSKKLAIPTFIRFYLFCLFYLIFCTQKKYKLIMAGRGALIFGAILNVVTRMSYCGFIIEYPELKLSLNQKLCLSDRLELKGILNSKFIITHDKIHADYIKENVGIKKLEYETIPNGTIGEGKINRSKFLHKSINLNKSQKILLHSGGFGPWFESQILAKESTKLNHDYVLVFHLSHNISKEDYYVEYQKIAGLDEKVFFSFQPVPSDILDELVSSAHIGIAWYSIKVLGFRAEKLGLGSGKIGNYLKCGLPVIVPEFESLDYVKKYDCGIQISNISEVSDAVDKIEKNYSYYSENAIKCYNEIWRPENYCESVLKKLSFFN
jgi:hypothetical protein